MSVLGIDNHRNENHPDRSWPGVLRFFKEKLPRLVTLAEEKKQGSGQDKLYAEVLLEVHESLKRQLGEMTFFQEVSGKESQDVQIDTTKLMQAPLSNLGCESEFA